MRSCARASAGPDLHQYHLMPHAEHGNPIGQDLIGVVEEVGPHRLRSRSATTRACSAAKASTPRVSTAPGMGCGGLQAELSRIPLADGSLVKVPGIDPATVGEPTGLAADSVGRLPHGLLRRPHGAG